MAQWVKNSPAMQETQETQVQFLEEGRATYSSILAWRIPRTEEPGGLQSMGSQSIGHDWWYLASTHAHTCWNYSCVVREDISGSFYFVVRCCALAERWKAKPKCSIFLFLKSESFGKPVPFLLYKISSRMLLSHKKEENNAICRNMNGPRDCHIQWSKEDKHHMILLICEI